jgi:hypothetical protein
MFTNGVLLFVLISLISGNKNSSCEFKNIFIEHPGCVTTDGVMNVINPGSGF